jgi:ABC-type transport system involved in multi-copper enzyme maturation permease subunit
LGREISFGGHEVVRIIFFVFSAFLFFSLQIFIFYLISSFSSSPNFSLLISTFVWITFVIIIPNTTWILARIIRDVPTKEHIVRTEDILKKGNIDPDCNWGWNSVWKREAPNPRIYNLASCFDKVDELHNNLFLEYRNKLFNQTELAINISSISPYYSFKFLNEKVSNNGYYKFKDFYLNLSNYVLIFKNFINSRDNEDQASYHLIFNHKYLCEAFMSRKNVDKNLIPQFMYDEKTTFIELIKLCSKEIIILLSWLIGVILLLFISFTRYDVR